MRLTRPSKTTHRLEVFVDGKSVADNTIEESAGGVHADFDFGVLNDCLASQGIGVGDRRPRQRHVLGGVRGHGRARSPACIAALGFDTGGVIGWCIGQAAAA